MNATGFSAVELSALILLSSTNLPLGRDAEGVFIPLLQKELRFFFLITTSAADILYRCRGVCRYDGVVL